MNEHAWTSLVLVRHGETDWNRAGRVQGTCDSALTARGNAQALAIAGVLAGESLQQIFASDLGRTQLTAAPLAAATGLTPLLDPRLRERSYGDLQGLTWAEVALQYPDAFKHLNAREPDYQPPGGESMLEFRNRVVAVMEEIVQRARGQRVAVVTHGGVVGVVYRYVRRMPLEAKRDYALFNGSINRFRVIDGRWQLDVWGDVSHLEGAASLDDFPGRD